MVLHGSRWLTEAISITMKCGLWMIITFTQLPREPIKAYPTYLQRWFNHLETCCSWAWKSYYIPQKHVGFKCQITVYPKKYAHGFRFAVLGCGYTLTGFPISIRLTSLALWQSNDCPSASKATLMNMDKYFMWIHYERMHNHNKAKHNKTVCIFLGIYCMSWKEALDTYEPNGGNWERYEWTLWHVW